LLHGIHLGESEAIALALEIGADFLLLDDSDARKRASEAGLRITGVLGVLLRAKKAGRISSLKTEIHRLRTEARFFIAPGLEQTLIVAAGE
jgi:predicted nucleic acid-binding protein